MVYQFVVHIDKINQMEMFYGDETIAYLMEHANDLADEFSKFDDIFTLTPNAHDQYVEVVKQTATDIDVLLKDTDDNKSGKTPSTVRSPVHGKITGSYGAGDGIITYTPNIGFVGKDSFDFKVNDGTTDSEVKTIYITVHK